MVQFKLVNKYNLFAIIHSLKKRKVNFYNVTRKYCLNLTAAAVTWNGWRLSVYDITYIGFCAAEY